MSEEEENANLAAAALEAVESSAQQAEEPIIVEEIPVSVDDELEQEPVEDSPIQEAVVVDEETGDAIPVVLVDEELVEQVLQDAAEDMPQASEPIVLVDEDEIVGNGTDTAKQLTEAGMADAKKDPKGESS